MNQLKGWTIMALALPATAITDNVLLAPRPDVAGLAPSALVHLAAGMLRVSAITALASPFLLVAWLVL
jgi:hypothetical protein